MNGLNHHLSKAILLLACSMAMGLFSFAAQAEIVVYNYDEAGSTNGVGRLTSVSDTSGTTKFNYDEIGRMTQTDKTVDGTTYVTHTAYDTIGRVESVTYPDNTTVNYAYNGPVLQRAYEGATNYVKYAGYNAPGQAASATFANGVVTQYTYSNSSNTNCPEHNFRLCTSTTALGANTYQNLRYGYDGAGNITSITDPLNGNQSFVPDDLDRLTSATGPYGVINYAYDQIGNMMTNSQVGSYTYPASGTNSVRPHAVTQAGGNSYTYDDNGDMTGGAGRNIAYDSENRPTSIAFAGMSVTFIYDADGGRVKKTVNGTTTTYIGKLYECANDVCTKHIFAGSQQIAQKTTSGIIYYYHTDHLGSSTVITDGNGNKVQSLAYYPYGGTRINSGSVDVHYKYTGQELDSETGLYFYNARYYDPVLGRFISADTLVSRPRNPQDLNRYSYVNNNPLNYIDPTGHSWLSEAFHDAEDWWSDTVEDANNFLEDIFDRLNVNVNAGAGASVNTEGDVEPFGLNPETGETFPYIPTSASIGNSTSTESFDLEIYVPAVGGVDCQPERCMPVDAIPPGQYLQLDYQGLLADSEVITSLYGMRYLNGKGEFHGGIDFAPPTRLFGTAVFAPSNGYINRVTLGGLYFRPIGFPSNSSLLFYHVSLSPNLAGQVPPIYVWAGTHIANTAPIGTSKPHVHIQFEVGGLLYNPGLIFPK